MRNCNGIQPTFAKISHTTNFWETQFRKIDPTFLFFYFLQKFLLTTYDVQKHHRTPFIWYSIAKLSPANIFLSSLSMIPCYPIIKFYLALINPPRYRLIAGLLCSYGKLVHTYLVDDYLDDTDTLRYIQTKAYKIIN